MALFQSGTYNLAPVAEQTPLPVGGRADAHRTRRPGQRHQRHCRCGQFGDQTSRRGAAGTGLDGQRTWQSVSGRPRRGHSRGAVGAARLLRLLGTASGVDVTPFFAVLDGPRIPAPGGPGFAAGYQALQPYFDEMFLGRTDVAATLGDAQAAANAAAER